MSKQTLPIEFTVFSRAMNNTPPVGGYSPVLILTHYGNVKPASWVCRGGGKDYDIPARHSFTDGKGNVIPDEQVLGYVVLPSRANDGCTLSLNRRK